MLTHAERKAFDGAAPERWRGHVSSIISCIWASSPEVRKLSVILPLGWEFDLPAKHGDT